MRLLLLMLLMTVIPTQVSAQSATYRGPHPVDLDGHWHLEDGAHDHGELVVGAQPFGVAAGVRIFLADPIAFGWDGEVWTFRGAHPLPGGVPGYCGLSAEHRHPFAPEGRFRRASTGAHIYIGGMRGGVAMVRPERTAPRHPIVRAPAIASPAPYWFWGCQYQLLAGTRGSLVPTALIPGCIPRSRRGFVRGTPGRTPGTSAAGAAPSGNWFDGNYTRWRSRDARGAPRPPPPTQRR